MSEVSKTTTMPPQKALKRKEEDSPFPAKKMSSTPTSLGLLETLADDDSLRSVLLRCPASDLVQLHKTCHRIRDIIDSPIFAKE